MSENQNLIKLNIIGTTGVIYKISLDPSQDLTIRELKQLISERMGISSEVFQLICNGKNLNENLKISDYQIYNNCNINCVERTEGGKV